MYPIFYAMKEVQPLFFKRLRREVFNQRRLIQPGACVPSDIARSKIKHRPTRRSLNREGSLFFFGFPCDVDGDDG